MSLLVVTGTGTGVGKTIVTAAIASIAHEAGRPVAVVKPAQTGLRPDEAGDLEDLTRLTGVEDVHEYVRYPDPLSPAAAARTSGRPTLDLVETARRIDSLRDERHLVVVEGAGGLLVRFDDDGWTLADLSRAMKAPVLVVASPGLGTLNTTALTLEAMAHRGLDLAGLVIGAWPHEPDLACRSNVDDLEMLTARPLAGVVPEGAGCLSREQFTEQAHGWLGPSLGGTFDAADFRRRHRIAPRKDTLD